MVQELTGLPNNKYERMIGFEKKTANSCYSKNIYFLEHFHHLVNV